MRNLTVVLVGLSFFMMSCEREMINSQDERVEEVVVRESKIEEDFFFSLKASDPENPSNVVLCTWSVASQSELCRSDLRLSEACDWMQTCNSNNPGSYANWTIDGGDTSICFS
jgi:hypothetical protein